MASFDPQMFEKANGPVIHVRDLPRRAVGEIVIIGVTNTTATGMVVFSMEDVHAGDGVELDQVIKLLRSDSPRPGTGNRPRFFFWIKLPVAIFGSRTDFAKCVSLRIFLP